MYVCWRTTYQGKISYLEFPPNRPQVELVSLGSNLKKGFPASSVCKESACNAGDSGSIPRLGRSPGEGKGYPIQYSGLENSMHSPWGRKKSDRDGSDKIFLLLVLILSS